MHSLFSVPPSMRASIGSMVEKISFGLIFFRFCWKHFRDAIFEFFLVNLEEMEGFGIRSKFLFIHSNTYPVDHNRQIIQVFIRRIFFQ